MTIDGKWRVETIDGGLTYRVLPPTPKYYVVIATCKCLTDANFIRDTLNAMERVKEMANRSRIHSSHSHPNYLQTLRDIQNELEAV